MSETNGYATRDALLGTAPKRRFTTETIDGHKFRLRSLNDKEKSAYDAAAINKEGKFNRQAAISANARLVQLCVVDGEGDLLFSGNDIPQLQELDAAMLSKLAAACQEHCGFTEADEAAKNSDTTTSDAEP